MSQLVLPVGVMGLKVNGKTPNPEPGSIIRVTAVRFKGRQENTRLCFVYTNTVSCDTQTQRRGIGAALHALKGPITCFLSLSE